MTLNDKQQRRSLIQYQDEDVQLFKNKINQDVERQGDKVPTITIQEVKSLTSIDQNYQLQASFEYEQIHPTFNHQTQQHPNKNPSIQSSGHLKTSIKTDPSNPQFQVVIHKINSDQSLHDENNHLIKFTKSELQIPLHLGKQQEETPKVQTQTEYVNIWKKEDQQVDQFYVKMIEDNWTKSQEEKSSVRKPLSHVDPIHQVQPQTQPFGIFNLLQQLSKVPDQTVNTTVNTKNETINNKNQEIHNKTEKINIKNETLINNKNETIKNKNEEIIKKPYFKIKKIKQVASGCSTLHNRDFSLKNSKQTNRYSSNQSEFIELKKQKSPLIFQRLSKKKLSNFSSTKNSPPNTKITSRKVQQNVKYEVIVGNQGETMNKILEDRTYNFLIGPTIKRDHSHPIILNFKQTQFKSTNSSQVPIKTIRKVIKRSPYGMLQLEVKDTNNQAKITNLRILKPKDMIKLKKIPKTIKNFKQSVIVS